MVLCTVRSCHLPLRREPRRWVCERGHAYDVARSGYTNLLQPNERRSRTPGDSAEAVAARRRIYERWNAPAMLPPFEAGSVLDVGCGDGYWLGALASSPARLVGIDISVPAIDAAARRYPQCAWFVANADRFIPFSDGSFDLVMSITARMNSPEFRRVLRDDGRLFVAVAGADDLRELRKPLDHDPAERAIELFAAHFTLLERKHVSFVVHLDAEGIRDVMISSYRVRREYEPRDVTFSRDLLLFAPKPRRTLAGSSA